jgi:AP-1 complex subunit gamma-1
VAAPTPAPAPSAAGLLAPANAPHPGLPGSSQPFVAYDKDGIRILYKFVKNPEMPQFTLVNANITNTGGVPLSNFSMQLAVPTFIKLQLDPPSSLDLVPGTDIVQTIKLNNTMHGQKPLLLKVKVSYNRAGTPVEDLSPPLSIPI